MRDILAASLDSAWIRAYTIRHYLQQHGRNTTTRLSSERSPRGGTTPSNTAETIRTLKHQWECPRCDVQWTATPDGNTCWICEGQGRERLWPNLA